uniref:Uncharacterized protein n=1 Tax=Parascaris univalens TaxID=6257 RepID=A0A915A5R3_PARUN
MYLGFFIVRYMTQQPYCSTFTDCFYRIFDERCFRCNIFQYRTFRKGTLQEVRVNERNLVKLTGYEDSLMKKVLLEHLNNALNNACKNFDR